MTSDRTPTKEQLKVIDSPEGRLIVTASAGAGKTYVLVERYLRHVVEEGLRPDQILTITFTKKAAAEMKGRIVSALRDRNLTEAAQIAETGPIQTIHSFCERLLRENALEAGLDPNFDILADAQSNRLLTECVRDALASDLEEAPYAEELIAYLTGRRRFSRSDRSPYGLLESAVQDVLQELRATGQNLDEVREAHATPESLRDSWDQAITRELDPRIRDVLPFTIGDTLQDRIVTAAKHLEIKRPSWAAGKFEEGAEDEALRHTCGLVQLACEAWWRLESEMTRLQSLDFTALEAKSVRLLEKSEATRERVRDQYRVAMVDEAQDMNPIQHRLLKAIQVEREMLVGDEKQSIYGFRQADVEAFKAYAEEKASLGLSKNHRSQPGILSFVDLVFSKLWSQSYVRMNRPGDPLDLDNVVSIDCTGVELWEQAARDTHATAQYISELIESGIRAGSIAVLVRDSGFAVELQERLKQNNVVARIAGGSERFYTRMEVHDLANALRAVADPTDDFALLACLRSPIVGLSLDSIVLLGREPDVAERLAGFEAPIAEDAERLAVFLGWYMPLRRYADRLSAWEVLSKIFAESAYLEALARRRDGEQLLANVRKLLNLAASEPELGAIEYAERIREIQDLRHKEGDAPAGADDADVVTLMTIHKSKGLEFDVVVVPQTDKPLASKGRDLIIEAQNGLVATRFGQIPSMMYRFLLDRKRERETEEELRVLYVALTRAKKRLCVCVYPRKPGTISTLLLEVLGDPAPPGVVVRNSENVAATPV